MIHGKITEIENYIPESIYKIVKPFLSEISEGLEEKTYEIDGEQIFAKVMSYETSDKDLCKVEAHEKYIDVQGTIAGAEGISVFLKNKIAQTVEYDENNDVAFYCGKETALTANAYNIEGQFTVLFPNEAHRPQETVDGHEPWVKKFVIKIRKDRWK